MAGIAPTYRIGPSDIFTSGDLAADAETLNSQVNSLDDQNWDKPDQALFDGWTAFMSEWRSWYRGTFFNFLGAGWNNGNRDQLIQFETRFGTFAADYARQSGNNLPGGVVAPSTGTKDGLGDLIKNQLQPLIPSIPVAVGVLVVFVAVVAAYFYFRFVRRSIGGG